LQLTNRYGQVDLSMIDPVEVAKMSDEQQAVLAIFVEAAEAREAAQVRLKTAEDAVRAAMRVETDAFTAHQAASPPMTALEAHRASIVAYNKSHS
jgi:hypothetical protein